MHDTGSVSTFQKHVLANDLLTDRQVDSLLGAQRFLHTVGIEKSELELALMLKMLDVSKVAQVINDIKAQWKISLPKPRVFNIAADKDEALQKSLAAKSPDLAQKVIECRKIQDGLKKLGLQLAVAEILICKGYYTPAELQPQGPVLRPAADTAELEAATPEPAPAPKIAAPKGATKRRDRDFEPAPAPEDRARKQKIIFVASLAGFAAVVIVAAAVVLGGDKPKKPAPQPDTAVKPEPARTETPKPVEPVRPPEPEKPWHELVGPKPTEPEKPKPDPGPANAASDIPAPAADNPTKHPDKPSDIPPAADNPIKPPPPAPPPQDPPPAPPDAGKQDPKDSKEAKRADREKKAEKLLEDARKLVTAQKWAEALATFRAVKDNYTDTAVYFDNSKEIREQMTECGYRVASAGLAKQALYKKPHMDTILGFTLTPPEGWRGIPNWQDLFGERDTSEQNYAGRSYRCGRYTSRWLETLYLDVYKTYAPGGPDSVVEGAQKIYTRAEDDLKDMDIPGSWSHVNPKYSCQRKGFVDARGNRKVVYGVYDPASKKGFGVVGYWKATRDDGFIIIRDGDKDKDRPPEDKDWEAAVKLYDQVARTFMILDQQTLSQTRLRFKGSPLATDGWFVQCSDFNVHVTANYVIEYSTRKDFAERLGRELENILAFYKRTIPSAKGVERGRVKLFDCEEDFLYYGQAYGAAAYWSPMQREIVAYRFEGRKVKAFESKEEMTVAEEKNPEEVTFNIIYHEAFHQYMENIMGISRDVYVPSWLNEGMGDYFFGGFWHKNGKFEIGLNDWRLETIIKAVKGEDNMKHVPLKSIFSYSQAQYYSNPGICYAEGWAICYFFMSEEGKKKGYNAIPARFFEELKKSGDYKKANAKFLDVYDLKAMEEEWKAFVLGLEKFLPKKKKEGEEEKKPEEKKR